MNSRAGWRHGGRRRHVQQQLDQAGCARAVLDQGQHALDRLQIVARQIGAVARGQHLDQQLVLAVEVVQHAGLGEVHAVGDAAQRRALRAGIGVRLQRGGEDLRPPRQPLRVRTSFGIGRHEPILGRNQPSPAPLRE
jgi:hypothetical protein